VTPASTAATVALETDIPIARTRALSPFADAVSVIGTDDMISVGIAEKATAVATEISVEPTITAARFSEVKMRRT